MELDASHLRSRARLNDGRSTCEGEIVAIEHRTGDATNDLPRTTVTLRVLDALIARTYIGHDTIDLHTP